MKYMGSKGRISKYLLPILMTGRDQNTNYVEPFCGGGNMIQEVKGKRIANDYNPYVIAALEAGAKGWIPPEIITEEDYKNIQKAKHLYSDHLVGYVGFAMSFGGKFFGGYRRDKKGQHGDLTNMIKQSKQSRNSFIKQSALLEGVTFNTGSYDELDIPPNSIIYCDPPYEGTTKYATGSFDSYKFWEWCRDKTDEGHTVYISEYSAPDDFIELWSKPISENMDSKKTPKKKAIEKLYTYI